ncbi:cytochrome c biogenesis protein ResB [Fodinicola feengrottensis]|uniref:Cytochrome c biogenesis protein ResB n=1 Tax=Fodinicola feengrottensis TaxID=435914 RepID=A0ABN2FQS6_9ACTN|nr:cytochrome c biogenesis protein ResB [Fodinicola feengrottensis]
MSLDTLSTAPAPVEPAPKNPRGKAIVVRWWRQLTSMRTALVLLFLLALAAVPGSLLPQQDLNPEKVQSYLSDHPVLGPILDKIGAYNVFGSPWFAAIYLLLFISLIGCLYPRIKLHAKALQQAPPAAPKFLDRMRHHAELPATDGKPAELAADLRRVLRRRRWRTVVREKGEVVEVSAEKGYLRETGNLVFHLSLLVLLIGVASGALWGWNANVLLTEGDGFCDSLQQYDQYTLGRDVTDSSLPPFCVHLRKFHADYLPSGEPSKYAADVTYDDGLGGPSMNSTIEVNDPLRFQGARIYLLDTGYSPIISYTDKYGQTFTSPSPFLPQDQNLSSSGIAVFADANQKPGAARTSGVEVAFQGVFTPTTPTEGPKVSSLSPAPRSPGLTLAAYRGDTGLSSGIPKSVYALDQNQIDRGKLKLVGTHFLQPGDRWKLDDGSTVAFVGYREWAGIRVDQNPGQNVVLVAAICIVLGLLCSLRIRRRRLWVRLTPDSNDSARTVVAVGGLSRTDADEFAGEFDRLLEQITTSLPVSSGSGKGTEHAD